MDLDSDDFLDLRIREVIVLDELMSTEAKDPIINDLFIEGSRHRNLSVIVLNQNLYFGKDPTQRRNYHYLVLFKNPIDRQPIVTLGRQMYPGCHDLLLQKFEEVTKEPYTFVVLDLKPETPEWGRLWAAATAVAVVAEAVVAVVVIHDYVYVCIGNDGGGDGGGGYT
jgi:hypothetical protein